MQELVNGRPGHLCPRVPTLSSFRESAARLRAYLVRFRERYGDDLDDEEVRLLEEAMGGAETLTELAAIPAGSETETDGGGTR